LFYWENFTKKKKINLKFKMKGFSKVFKIRTCILFFSWNFWAFLFKNERKENLENFWFFKIEI